jgi:uncharacterized protein
MDKPHFMIDQNAGKLTKLLRLLGFDTVYFYGETDTELVNICLQQNRVLLTRDTHIKERNLITGGRVKSVLITDENPREQIIQVINELSLKEKINPFTLCLECNTHLVRRSKEEIKDRIPTYVFQTQNEFMECPCCRRIYWKGTHWNAMNNLLKEINNRT